MGTSLRYALQLTLLGAAFLGGTNQLLASGPDIGRAHLAAMLRQLDTLERHTERSAALPSPVGARYHFDYLRLREDLQRIRSGVQDYLTPQRAQPRDPVPLVGDYIGEVDAP